MKTNDNTLRTFLHVLQSNHLLHPTRSRVQHLMRGRLVLHERKLRNDRVGRAWKLRYMAIRGFVFQIGCNQPAIFAALDPDLGLIGWKTGVWCLDVHEAGHDERVSCGVVSCVLEQRATAID